MTTTPLYTQLALSPTNHVLEAAPSHTEGLFPTHMTNSSIERSEITHHYSHQFTAPSFPMRDPQAEAMIPSPTYYPSPEVAQTHYVGQFSPIYAYDNNTASTTQQEAVYFHPNQLAPQFYHPQFHFTPYPSVEEDGSIYQPSSSETPPEQPDNLDLAEHVSRNYHHLKGMLLLFEHLIENPTHAATPSNPYTLLGEREHFFQYVRDPVLCAQLGQLTEKVIDFSLYMRRMGKRNEIDSNESEEKASLHSAIKTQPSTSLQSRISQDLRELRPEERQQLAIFFEKHPGNGLRYILAQRQQQLEQNRNRLQAMQNRQFQQPERKHQTRM